MKVPRVEFAQLHADFRSSKYSSTISSFSGTSFNALNLVIR